MVEGQGKKLDILQCGRGGEGFERVSLFFYRNRRCCYLFIGILINS